MFSQFITAALLASSVVALPAKPVARSAGQTPFKINLPNGFPNIKIPSDQLTAVQKQAHGTLPNTPLPKSISNEDFTTFSVIAFGETFEVAYFTALIHNITSGAAGYEIDSPVLKKYILETLRAVQAQEELHALGANAILATAGRPTQEPCEYIFPVDTFDSAIALASEFTDVVLGTLQDVQAGLIASGDGELVPLIGSIIGQEGEQDGYYRSLSSLIPSQLPFLTRSTGAFVYSAVNQNFIVPGSCPTAHLIDVPIFPALAVNKKSPAPMTQHLEFTFKNNNTNLDSIAIAYINQQNLPIVEKVSVVSNKNDMVTVSALFPYEANLLEGLTIAAITDCAGPFTTADEVAAATLYGPALIEIN